MTKSQPLSPILTAFFTATLYYCFLSNCALAADLPSNSPSTQTNQTLEQKELPNQLGTYRHLQFLSNNSIEIYAVTLNDNYHARIYQQPEKNQWFAKSISDLTREQNVILGINGGFYSTHFEPAGLFIDQGQTLQGLKRSRLLNTCIGVDRDQKLFLGKQRGDCLHAYYAMQTGPLLIDHGNVNQNIKTLEQKSKNLGTFFAANRRTILAETSDGKFIVLITPSATLLEIAGILKNYPAAFGAKKIVIALDLDGGASTGMYIHFPDNPFYFSEIKWVKTFVFFN